MLPRSGVAPSQLCRIGGALRVADRLQAIDVGGAERPPGSLRREDGGDEQEESERAHRQIEEAA